MTEPGKEVVCQEAECYRLSSAMGIPPKDIQAAYVANSLGLRGEAGQRQVANPTAGLVENTGGIIQDEAAIATITLLKR